MRSRELMGNRVSILSSESYYERVNKLVLQLKNNVNVKETSLADILYKPTTYKVGSKLPDSKEDGWVKFENNARWGGTPDFHAWFYTHVSLGKEFVGKTLRFQFNTDYCGWAFENPQFLVYVNGKVVQGIDLNHRYFELEYQESFDLHIYGYTSFDCFRELSFFVNVCEIDKDTEKLYYDVKTPFDILAYTDKNSKQYADILYYLNETLKLVDFRVAHTEEYRKSVQDALAYIENEFYGAYCKKQDITCACVGQTHIDVAWLWTFAQTREKAQRSFATVVENMRKYPEYTFFCSQPYLYKAVKEEDPYLYAQIQEKVKEGRFEIEGGLWLETDTNLPSGESLVRQILHGKKFFKEEFGVDSHIVWLPDAFGYSAALPQLFKLSGIDTFVTSKISWNDKNTMPHDVFTWRGIDGSDVFTYFITCQSIHSNRQRLTTYNAEATPDYLAGAYDRFSDKQLTDKVLVAYGYGDGGGGPTAEQIETVARMKRGIPGCPNAENSTLEEFFSELKKKTKGKLPKWVGELYLEFHRGTYTTIGKNKRNNRKIEFLMHNVEALATMNHILSGAEYPYETLEKMWEQILNLQFHDILPGSSIKEVYDDSDKMYEELFAKGTKLLDEITKNISTQTKAGDVVFNMQPYNVNSDVEKDGKFYTQAVPAYGFSVAETKVEKSTVTVSEKTLENAFYRVKFDDKYEIVSIYDKLNQREIVKPNAKANALIAYEDVSIEYDAWEIRDFYTEKAYPIDSLSKCEIVDFGAKKGFRIHRTFLDSTIEQTVLLSDNVPRIDFVTNVDWKQEHLLVKAKFPVDVFAERATFDIQFGNLERPIYGNTSWDVAKFETCAHKYVDISENGYGVSLLNDCKYGHDVMNGELGLTLLRSPTWPYADADKGKHTFTYSLYAHSGRLADGDTVKLAFDLNNPLFTVKSNGFGDLDGYSMISCESPNIVIDTVKMSEDGKGVIVRLYETQRIRTQAKLRLGFTYQEGYKCDLLENRISEQAFASDSVELSIKPYEIVTLKFVL